MPRHVALAPAAASFGQTRFRPEDQPKETGSVLEEPVSDRSQGNGEGEIVASRLEPPYHIYRLDEATVAAAAAAGHGLPALLEALAGLGVQLSPAQLATLQAWHARGHELQLLALPLLRAARPELLARLLAHADVRAGLGELLSPTVAVAALPPADLAARLRAAGFFPQGPGTRDQESGDRSQEPENSASASRPQHPASTPQSWQSSFHARRSAVQFPVPRRPLAGRPTLRRAGRAHDFAAAAALRRPDRAPRGASAPRSGCRPGPVGNGPQRFAGIARWAHLRPAAPTERSGTLAPAHRVRRCDRPLADDALLHRRPQCPHAAHRHALLDRRAPRHPLPARRLSPRRPCAAFPAGSDSGITGVRSQGVRSQTTNFLLTP